MPTAARMLFPPDAPAGSAGQVLGVNQDGTIGWSSTVSVLATSPANLADPQWGLALDGVTDDSAALAAVFGSSPRSVFLPDGKVLFFASPITIPGACELRIGAGASLLCGITTGANAVLLDNAAAIVGTNRGGTATSSPQSGSSITATTYANIGALVANLHTDGTQEYAYLEDIQLVPTAGATIATLLLIEGIAINSGFRRVNFRANGVATNALVINGISAEGFGEISVESCWFSHPTGHCIVIDTPAGAHSPQEIWFSKCAIEYWGTGFDGINVGATNNVIATCIRDCHFERNAADTSATNCVNLINSVGARIDAVTVNCDSGSGANVTLVRLGSGGSVGTAIDRLYANTSVTLVNDVNRANTLSGAMLQSYRQGISLVQGDAPRSTAAPVTIKSTPVYSASITPSAVLGGWQTITVTNTTAFTINAPTSAPTSVETQQITIEILNSSGGAMGAITWNAAYVFNGFIWANPANGKHRFATFQWNGANWICTSMSGADY